MAIPSLSVGTMVTRMAETSAAKMCLSTACRAYRQPVLEKYRYSLLSMTKFVNPQFMHFHCLLKSYICIVEAKRTWHEHGHATSCDTDKGEKTLQSIAVSSVGQCKTFCEQTTGCQSITYFTSGLCTLYSTPCTSTTASSNGVAMSLITDTSKASKAEPCIGLL